MASNPSVSCVSWKPPTNHADFLATLPSAMAKGVLYLAPHGSWRALSDLGDHPNSSASSLMAPRPWGWREDSGWIRKRKAKQRMRCGPCRCLAAIGVARGVVAQRLNSCQWPPVFHAPMRLKRPLIGGGRACDWWPSLVVLQWWLARQVCLAGVSLTSLRQS